MRARHDCLLWPASLLLLLLLGAPLLAGCATIARAAGGPEAVALRAADSGPRLNAEGAAIVTGVGVNQVEVAWLDKDGYLVLAWDGTVHALPAALVEQLLKARSRR